MGDSETDMKYCSNCKKDISAANFVMHEVHCRRHIVLCEHCKEPVPRTELEQHFNDLHSEVKCSRCGESVEKNDLADHMDNSCVKKPVQCYICDLEMPSSELDSHIDYCGSRTEACPKCGQFIMLKDLGQHDSSGCEYPTPKPPVPNGRDTDRNHLLQHDEFEFADSFYNPFAFDEIHRILDQPQVPSRLTSDIPAFGRQIPESILTRGRIQMHNNTSSRKSTTNRKSELNRQRERVLEPDPDNDDEYGQMLAMQLAQDLDQEENLDQLIQNYQKKTAMPSRQSPDYVIPPDLNTYPSDDELLPCEFCGEPFPTDILVQHQSGCDPLSSGAWSRDIGPRVEGRNNQVEGSYQRRSTSIPVINNLESPVSPEWESPPRYEVGLDEDEIMLPCEFCSELFPVEVLVQHQAVCDANTSVTPRVTTPVAKKPQLKKRSVLSSSAQEMLQATSRTCRHQELPDLQTLTNQIEGDNEILEQMLQEERSHQSQTSSASSKSSLSRSAASKYGVGLDRYDNHLTRLSRHDARNGIDDNIQENTIGQDRPAARRNSDRKNSTTRTRNTLDQLLQDTDHHPEHDLLAGIGNSQKKAAKNQDNFVRKSSHGTTTAPKRKPASSSAASARDVYRELNRPGNQSSQRPRRADRANGHTDPNPPFDLQVVGQTRSRQRSNVFNSSNRRQANPPQSRRPHREPEDK